MPPKSVPAESDSQVADQSQLLDFVGYNIRRAYIIVQATFDEGMRKLDLRQAEFSVLSVVKDNAGISQKTLAEALAVAPPNLALVIDRLESRGLIRRERDEEDRRVYKLTLTAQGARLYTRALKAVIEADAIATARLGAAEQQQLKALLQKIFIE